MIQLEGYGQKGFVPETMVVSHQMTAVLLILQEREGEEGLVSETEDLQQEGLAVDVFELVERVG